MADIDSAGARNRQAPARSTPAKKPRRVTPVSRSLPEKRPVEYFNRVGESRSTPTGRTRRKTRRTSNRSYNSNQQAISRRRSRSNSTGGNRSISRAATKSSPPPTAKVIIPPAPPKPAPPSIDKFLAGDSTYQRQMAAYNKAMVDFQSDQELARTDYNTGYQSTRRDIGLAKEDALTGLEDDYASRGLLKSGIYNDALGDLNRQYLNQYGDLDKQRTSFLEQLALELQKYTGEQGVQKGNTRAEAIRRRAERYNL